LDDGGEVEAAEAYWKDELLAVVRGLSPDASSGSPSDYCARPGF
jgi:hypothetical protein